ncbi:MAG: M17 family peptidase N-terminal domain-containing protein, partial [Arenimonas sp.]
MALQFQINTQNALQTETDCLVVGVYADKSLSPTAKALDEASGGRLNALLDRGDVSGKTGRTSFLHDVTGVKASRVLVVGLGEAGKFAVPQYIKAIADAVRALRVGPVKNTLITLTEIAVKSRDADWNLRQAVIAADHAAYEYTATRSKKAEVTLEQVSVQADAAQAKALSNGIAIATGVQLTRELGNLPPNICNPDYLAQQARKIAAEHESVTCEVLEREDMETLGMGSLLAVARGSFNAPKLIVLKWNGGGNAKPFALVGKGITFDSGGINLKTQGGIEEMKFDMLGAGTVFGAFLSAVLMKLPLN